MNARFIKIAWVCGFALLVVAAAAIGEVTGDVRCYVACVLAAIVFGVSIREACLPD